MKTSQILTTTTAIALMTLIGCSKYPDGPMLSVRGKTERVANDWRVGEAIDNEKDVTDQYHRYEYNMTKDGKVTLTAEYTILGIDYNVVTEGVWAFLNNNEKISFDYEDENQNRDYVILKLEEKEMWLLEDNGTLELHLIPR
ncbi:MAG: hypothetical protein WEC59_03310 [Salibacteraceae bacterium]